MVLFVVAMNGTYANSGIKFFEGTWDEIVAKSELESKMIFVDFYAKWCGPCKWMARDVFTNDAVSNFFNENFINVSVDAENEMISLVNRINIDAYPTLVVFDSKGKIVKKAVGALDTDALIQFGKMAMGSPKAMENYMADPDDYNNVLNYASLVHESSPKDASDIIEDYLSGLNQEEFVTIESWNLITDFLIDYESTTFQRVINNKSHFMNYDGFGYYLLGDILGIMLTDAFFSRNENLLPNAIDFEIQIRDFLGELEYPEEYYKMETWYMYYFNVGEFEKYLITYDDFLKTYHWNNHDRLSEELLTVADQIHENSDRQFYELVLSMGDRCIELDADDWVGYYGKALIFYFMNDPTQSTENVKLALNRASDSSVKTSLKSFMDHIKNSFYTSISH
jgi:thiol-disulfide isomerase/thioredoxin